MNGVIAAKPATNVSRDTPILVLSAPDDDFASRGAHKLIGALDAFGADGLRVDGRRCLDAGASTGGFTDVLLRRGAAEIVAVDVGYGQLIWRLQNDERVHVVDRTNVRHLDPETIGGAVDLIVADLSFISLSLVLPALRACLREGGDLVPMVKPQFEVGKDRVGSGGVVRDPELRATAVADVADEAAALGLTTRGVVASPLPGPSGNVEYFLWLTTSGNVGSGAARSGVAGVGDDKVGNRIDLPTDGQHPASSRQTDPAHFGDEKTSAESERENRRRMIADAVENGPR